MMAEKPSEAHTPDSTTSREDRSSGNWWDSWITSAKSKSAEVYSMVKKDLDEIGSAVKSEASHVFSTTSSVIGKTLKLDEPESTANVMKKSFSTFIGQVNTVLNPEPDDEEDTEVILSSGDTTMLSTYKKELEALQRVDATFIVPANSAEFDAWRASLEGGACVVSDGLAHRRLSGSPVLAAQYRKLVPDAVTHNDFWERYLFRVALLQDRLAAASRKQPLEEETTDPVLAHLPLQTPPIVEQSPKKVLSGIEISETTEDLVIDHPVIDHPDIDNVVVWEDGKNKDFADNVELTEEQQILLLEEYEKEISTRKMKPTILDVTNKKQTRDKMNNIESPKREGKSDVCGNNLVEDYFAEKDDGSANSDESWEKEFEIDDVKA